MTSRFVATTLLDVYRDNTGLPASGSFDGYDDDPESAVPLHAGLPGHLYNTGGTQYDPASGRWTTIERWTGRMRPGADVAVSDRIRDQKTGYWFVVDAADMPAGVTGAADVRLKLTRVPR